MWEDNFDSNKSIHTPRWTKKQNTNLWDELKICEDDQIDNVKMSNIPDDFKDFRDSFTPDVTSSNFLQFGKNLNPDFGSKQSLDLVKRISSPDLNQRYSRMNSWLNIDQIDEEVEENNIEIVNNNQID